MVPCEFTSFEVYDGSHFYNGHETKLILTYSTDEEEQEVSYVTIQEASLIGQVGGILGITMGWSFLDLMSIVEQFFSALVSMIANS